MDGRVEEAAPLLDPDIDWLEPAEQPDRRVVHGADAVLSALNEWLGGWEDYAITPPEFTEGVDGMVLAAMRHRGRGPGSSAVVEGDLFHVWELRAGRPVRMEMFLRRDAALAAAGVP
jgi:ketosteroid isomerase-like protein